MLIKPALSELPFGWEKQVNAEGKIFYVDHINSRTTYADPRLAFAVEENERPGDFRQRFDASSTALQVLHGRDLSGKVAIVTGANCGIGLFVQLFLDVAFTNIIIVIQVLRLSDV